MSDFNGLYSTRGYKNTDKAFIMSSFLIGLYYGDSWFSNVPKDIFMKNYKVFIEKLLTKSLITIACLPDDPDVILGYSVLSHDTQVVHFIYVKNIWRQKGIGKSLCPKHPTSVSHLTGLGKKLLKEKLINTVFNPFSI